MKTEIIYEDKDLLIVRKPAGLAVQTAHLGQADCVSELKNYLHQSAAKKREPYLGVIHRLDQPVEGLLAFAKTKAAAALLSAQLTEHVMNKKYYAVAMAEAPEQKQEKWVLLEDQISKDSKAGKACIGEKTPQSKTARLRYRITDRKDALVRLEIELETGRFHQIRAQMAYHGMPLLGDHKYGIQESEAVSRELGIKDVALCAYCLELKHPVTGRWEVWECRPQNPAFRLF